LKIVVFITIKSTFFSFLFWKKIQISNTMKLEGKKPLISHQIEKHQEILLLTSHSKNGQRIYRPIYMTPSFIKVILDQSSSNIQCKRTMNFMIVLVEDLTFCSTFLLSL
jgi:hypothetical protein